MGIKSYETLHKRIINNSFATPVNTMGSAMFRIFVVHFSQIFQQLIRNSFLQSFDTQNTIFAHPKAIFRNLFIKQNIVGMSDTTLLTCGSNHMLGNIGKPTKEAFRLNRVMEEACLFPTRLSVIVVGTTPALSEQIPMPTHRLQTKLLFITRETIV